MDTNKLKSKMVEAGYTQRSLAIAMGKSKNTINAIFMGTRSPRVDEAKEICKILNITKLEEKSEIFLL